MVIVQSHLTLTIERLISIKAPEFHKNPKFRIVIYTKKTCRSMYKADVKFYDLARKHELYKSYEITKSLVTALIANAIQQMLTFLFVGLQYQGLLFPKTDYYKTLFILHMLWNSNFSIFAWVLLLSHRSSRLKILAAS
ncbi:hypothetical protein GCK72_016699 [Caenorhabditis remanei]|uniref:Uncharacterized protein n=1 Tax=Caenorhabditis remanei TaxID=31234 RepID=A0A6A5G5Z7_CAERE|nr:hypothetical protein GCK72_016699 [Caenorhabditis remanei]KAF1750152.1 hypothetical protein GCK72_016699 [Caenorhabditis remanei]